MTRRGQRAIYSMLALVALGFTGAAVANAQVTVTSVKVTVSSSALTAVYCDTSTTCTGGLQIWSLGGGIHLNANETLVLTQTGGVPVAPTEGNFDTSDQVTATGAVGSCSTVANGISTPPTPCTVRIEINGTQVYQSAAGDPLDFGNKDDSTVVTSEAHNWVLAATQPTYTLQLGYADNSHNNSVGCATPCFPSPWQGAVTHFLGAGLPGGNGGLCSGSCYDGGALLITGVSAPVTAVGRMTGGGSVFTPDGTRVTHGFEIHCDITDSPNTLEVNWPPANNFHMDKLTSATCTDDPNIHQQPPKSAPFDTFIGTGTGKLNGVPNSSIAFTFVDAGEPGTSDTATYVIKDNLGNVVFTVPVAFLTKGNQQTHK